MPSATFFHLPQAKQEKLLLAARAEFTQAAYDAASINRIIRRAGIPRGSFYMYFRDKEDLFRYLLEQDLRLAARVLEDNLEREGGDLFAAFRALFDHVASRWEEPRVQELAAVLRLNAGSQQGPLLRSISPPELMEPVLARIDRSRLSLRRKEDLEEMLEILLGVTPASLCAAACRDPEQVREHYLAKLDILSRGMSARQEIAKGV